MNYFLRKISFRYLYHKGSKAPSSQTILTSLGVGFGTAVLIIVLSVMNGFENELQKRILGVIPHVTLESSGGFEDLENKSEIILDVDLDKQKSDDILIYTKKILGRNFPSTYSLSLIHI